MSKEEGGKDGVERMNTKSVFSKDRITFLQVST